MAEKNGETTANIAAYNHHIKQLLESRSLEEYEQLLLGDENKQKEITRFQIILDQTFC